MLHEDYCIAFRQGDEKALNYVYVRYYKPLCNHGRQIVDDEFTVSCIVQEAFLKGWKFREVMESMRHIYCFIRLDVSWKCYAYLRSPARRFQRCIVHELTDRHVRNLQEEESHHFFDEERLQVIEKALPYLPANKQTIMSLYFTYGLSHKKIARRFGTSGRAITVEVQKSLESLKNIVHAQKKLDSKPLTPATNSHACTNMDMEMEQIFRLRYEQKYSFASIAHKMNLSQGYVQQQYVAAHQKLRQLYRK